MSATPPIATVPFDDLPGFGQLWRQYRTYGNTNVHMIGGAIARSLAAAPSLAELVRHARDLPEPALPRSKLVGALETILADLGGPHPAQADALARLREPGTVAVVTGQQPGLLGGPAFVLYKAMTAIELARQLNDAGQPAVAVYWVAGEDHDLLEANQVYLPDARRAANGAQHWRRHRLDLRPSREPMRCRVHGEPGARQVATWLHQHAVARAGDPATRDFLAAIAPRADESLAAWQMRFLSSAFGSLGMLIVEPLALRNHSVRGGQRVFAYALSQHEAIERSLAEQADLLRREDSEFAPDPQRHAHVFVDLDGTGRRRLWRVRDCWALERDDETYAEASATRGADYSDGAIIALLDEQPAAFSSNFMTRPLVQAASIPTVAYVGGPGELRYQCLLPPILRALELPQPVLFPRCSLSLVDDVEHAAAVLRERADFDRAAAAVPTDELELVNELGAIHGAFVDELAGLVPPLRAGLTRAGERLLADVDDLRQALRNQPMHFVDGDARERIESATAPLVDAPGTGSQLQERWLPSALVLARLGIDTVRALASDGRLDPFAFAHYLVGAGPNAV